MRPEELPLPPDVLLPRVLLLLADVLAPARLELAPVILPVLPLRPLPPVLRAALYRRLRKHGLAAPGADDELDGDD